MPLRFSRPDGTFWSACFHIFTLVEQFGLFKLYRCKTGVLKKVSSLETRGGLSFVNNQHSFSPEDFAHSVTVDVRINVDTANEAPGDDKWHCGRTPCAGLYKHVE